MSRYHYLLVLGALATVASVFAAYKVKSVNVLRMIDGPGFGNALSELTYTGEAACASPVSVKHESIGRILPLKLDSGHCYVFHIPQSITRELHLYLAKRLREDGIRILSEPVSASDFVYLSVGGPLFKMEFKVGQQKGVLMLLQHDGPMPADAGRVRMEDLVLRFDN